MTEQQPYRPTVDTIAAYHEPRMPSVTTLIETFNMGRGDFTEISVGETPLNRVNNALLIF